MTANATNAAGLVVGFTAGNQPIFLALDQAGTLLDVQPFTPALAPKAVVVNNVGSVPAGTPFTVTGTLSGYSSPPALTYATDGGTAQALPAGATVTTSAFSFQHPAVAAAGSHTVRVADAAAGVGATGSITITAIQPTPGTIAINTLGNIVAGSAFTVSGILTGYSAAPTLTYTDDSGAAQALPSGSTVTAAAFSFAHPSMTAGTHTLRIADATGVSATLQYTVAPASTGTVIGVPLGVGPGGNLRRASILSDIIGINIHPEDRGLNNPYSRINDTRAALDFLNPGGKATGLFRLRDELRAYCEDTGFYEPYYNNLAAAGYRFGLYTGYGPPGSWNPQGDAIRTFCQRGWVDYVEGPLEFTNFGLENSSYLAKDGRTYTFGQAAAKWQMDLWDTFGPSTSYNLPIVFASHGTGDPGNGTATYYACLAMGRRPDTISTNGSAHFYGNFNCPVGTNYQGLQPTQIDDEANKSALATGGLSGLPVIITEFGYQNSQTDSFAKSGTIDRVAKHYPNVVADILARNIARLDIYELFDRWYSGVGGGYEDHWGIFSHTGTILDAAVTWRWLFGLFADTALNKRSFFTGSLSPTVTGLGPFGRHFWFQKASGEVLGLIAPNDSWTSWNGSWDNPVLSAVTPPTRNVDIRFPATYTDVKVYDLWRNGPSGPTCSTYRGQNPATSNCPAIPAPVQTLNNVNRVAIAIQGTVHVVRIAQSQ